MMEKSTFIVLFLVCISLTFALPVDSELVQRAAGGWLLKNTTPMNTAMSQEISSVNPFYSDGGQVLYYVVGLNPSGFVIFSANDRVEPVIAFSSSGIYDSNENNPLTILLKEDMQTRLEQIETKAFSASSAAGADTLSPQLQKWQTLVDSGNVASGESLIQPMGVSTVSDVRVPPLMMTLWDQGNADGGYC